MTRPDDCILETRRLWLCRPDADRDLDMWAETQADAEAVRYIGGQVMDRAQSWRQLCMVLGHWEARGYGFMSCIRKQDGLHIGRVGPWNPLGWPEPEVGWTLHPDFHGQGYASEAGRTSIDYARDKLGWSRVIHVIQHGNLASAKLAERMGSSHLYDVDGIPGVTKEACWVYGQDFE